MHRCRVSSIHWCRKSDAIRADALAEPSRGPDWSAGASKAGAPYAKMGRERSYRAPNAGDWHCQNAAWATDRKRISPCNRVMLYHCGRTPRRRFSKRGAWRSGTRSPPQSAR
jgi:hypothetical protein